MSKCPSVTDSSRDTKNPEKKSGWRCSIRNVNADNCPSGFKNWNGKTVKSDSDSVAGDFYCYGDFASDTWRYRPDKCYKSDYSKKEADIIECCTGKIQPKDCDPKYCENSKGCTNLLSAYCQKEENINKPACTQDFKRLNKSRYNDTMTTYCKKDNLKKPSCVSFCKDNQELCEVNLQNYCKDKYNDSTADNACSCYYDASYYNDLNKKIQDEFTVPKELLSSVPECMYYKCKNSSLARDKQKKTCPPINLSQCFQKVNINATKAEIKNLVVNTDAKCRVVKKKDEGGGSGGDSGGGGDGGGDDGRSGKDGDHVSIPARLYCMWDLPGQSGSLPTKPRKVGRLAAQKRSKACLASSVSHQVLLKEYLEGGGRG